MGLFITEAERKEKHTTCCFEFQRGRFQNSFWREDSICLEADIFDELKLFELFKTAVPHFDYYGLTEVSLRDWQALRRLSDKRGGLEEKVILELTPWAEACFKDEEVFTICGI